jgi:hypothetical protein
MRPIERRIARVAPTFLRAIALLTRSSTSSRSHPDVRVIVRGRSAARKVARPVPALLSAALICPTQPALADFTQNGPKLVGTGAVGTNVQQCASVALFRGGNTAIVGGHFDNSFAGASLLRSSIRTTPSSL